MKTLRVVLHTPDVQDFLAENCTDIDAAVEQYRAEYERRLRAQYPDVDVNVEAGETNGMGDYVYVDGWRVTASDCDEIPWIEQPLADMVDDWDWLTVPYTEAS